MKRLIYKFLFGSLMLLNMTACDLDRQPLTSYGADDFWSNERNAYLALVGIYHANTTFGSEEYAPTDWWSYQGLLMLDIVSDNAWDRRGLTSNYGIMAAGTLSASKTGATSNYWTFSYKKIARCNKFLEEWENYTGEQTETMLRYRAEARFLRATQYFYLASFFHDVPLVTKTLTMDEANTVSKTGRAQIVDWVITEMQEAAQDLPKWSVVAAEGNYGRACKQAALAFKGRAELMMQKWEAAASTYKEIIDMGDNQLSSNYAALFQPATADALSENIFVARYDDDKCGTGMLKQFNPTMDGAVGGWCLFNVTADLFEAYPFVDGTPFSYHSPLYDPTDLAKNRDPRLAMTLYWNGATFGQGIYNCDPDKNAANGKDGLHPAFQSTKTGYMMRKYIDENYIYSGGDNNKYPAKLPVIRYAEVLLSYVEAKMEDGTLTAADLDYLNQVRQRPGVAMPAITAVDAVTLRPLLRQERRVEMALEGMRLWDLLRWGVAKEVISGDVWGASFPGSPATINRNQSNNKVDPEGVDRWYVGTRAYADGPTVWPISQSEQDINPNLRN
ncbi:MAG: RagB/SusD family nutrient uptake outer membrane protein [Phocaeicola plebeius]|nr:RagB/SusD family nutrient uptake outer membrane protein [Phocaeicola plebeius]